MFLILIFSRFVDERSVLNNMDEDRLAPDRLASDRSGREEYDFVTPEMLHLRPVIAI